jgi:hypothetical protein
VAFQSTQLLHLVSYRSIDGGKSRRDVGAFHLSAQKGSESSAVVQSVSARSRQRSRPETPAREAHSPGSSSLLQRPTVQSVGCLAGNRRCRTYPEESGSRPGRSTQRRARTRRRRTGPGARAAGPSRRARGRRRRGPRGREGRRRKETLPRKTRLKEFSAPRLLGLSPFEGSLAGLIR